MLINRRKNNISIYTTVRNKWTRTIHFCTNKSHKHGKEDISLGKKLRCLLYKIKNTKLCTHLRDTHISDKITKKSKKLVNTKFRVRHGWGCPLGAGIGDGYTGDFETLLMFYFSKLGGRGKLFLNYISFTYTFGNILHISFYKYFTLKIKNLIIFWCSRY